jgi:hypothetical protein
LQYWIWICINFFCLQIRPSTNELFCILMLTSVMEIICMCIESGTESRALCLLGKHCTTEATALALLFLFYFIIYFVVLGFELKASYLLGRHSTTWALFCVGYFWDGISWTICPDWLWTSILLSFPFQSS